MVSTQFHIDYLNNGTANRWYENTTIDNVEIGTDQGVGDPVIDDGLLEEAEIPSIPGLYHLLFLFLLEYPIKMHASRRILASSDNRKPKVIIVSKKSMTEALLNRITNPHIRIHSFLTKFVHFHIFSIILGICYEISIL